MNAAQPEASDYQAAHEGLRRTQARTRQRLRRLVRAARAHLASSPAAGLASLRELERAIEEAESELS